MPAQNGSTQLLATIVLSTVVVFACAFWAFLKSPGPETGFAGSMANQNSQTQTAPSNVSAAGQELFPVIIRQAAGPPRVDLGIHDSQGNSITAACSTCHATRQPNSMNRLAEDLDEFHGGLTIAHGNQSCLACHNSGDYDSLRLADGSRLEFTDVMTLCSQCHGTQRRDYDHGVHGGMNGYWDLKKGPRTRNNCIDCHDPHSPKFPAMRRTFFPQDRFLDNGH